MAPIAGEEIVAAGARQQHLDPHVARAPADGTDVKRGRIRLRLVEVVDHLGQVVEDLRARFDDVQADAEVLCERLRVRQVVRHSLVVPGAIAEGDREAVELSVLRVRLASATRELESRPPDRNAPTGTSAIICRSVAASICSRSDAAACTADPLNLAVWNGSSRHCHARTIDPDRTIRACPGSSFDT